MKINKQPVKTRAKATIIASTLAILSSVASAETYTVSIEMNSSIGEAPLVATQTQPMNYPVLEIADATREGAYCLANGTDNSIGFDRRSATAANSLCPGATPDYAIVQFSGVPNAFVTVERSLETQEQNGIRFTHHNGRPYNDVITVVLNATEGLGEAVLWSGVFLIDKSQVTDAVMEFSYDISAAYQ